MNLALEAPSPKQVQFYKAATKHVGFGGARGGGKSHAVRTKAVLLAFEYPGIRMLIVRRTYPELVNNHINQLRVLLRDVARYNDKDKVLYRILELYGCTRTPNEGLKWAPDRQFAEIARIEREHPWLAGRRITGVADPAIWDASHGVSIAEEAARKGVLFTPGDHERIPGWMQCHYRLRFDDNGYPMMYVFSSCAGFRRTIPGLMYDEHKVEDLDTDGEDHIADEWRYMCMSRPIKPVLPQRAEVQFTSDPLNQMRVARRDGRIITTQIRLEE